MTDTPDAPAGEWFELTFHTRLQVTDRTAAAAAAFDRIIDPETGEEAMMTWSDYPPNWQLQFFLSRVLHAALDQVGERAGFTSRLTWRVELEPVDPPPGI